MPTGYTAKLYEGEPQSAREFILACSRAFGATIRQRDESPDVPPRPVEADTRYYDESIAAALKVLDEAPKWSDEEAERRARAENEAARRAWEASEAARLAIRVRYEAMIAEVEQWEPPTPEHAGLKTFMLEQLRDSIKFDGFSADAPVAETGAEYRERVIARAKRDIKYGRENRWAEIERVQGANRWIEALYESLPASDRASA